MPKISLCVIVKNEEALLGQCLTSVSGLVDEIIIVDTGSTDKTKEIAASFGANIYDFTWIDNFAAARNESLKHATGDWILVLDADEVIVPEDYETVRKLVANDNFMGYSMLQRNYINDMSVLNFTKCPNHYKYNKNYLGWWDCFIIRLFRNNPKIRFKGELHEVIDESIKNQKGKVSVANIIIHHYSEEKGMLEKKTKLEKYSLLAERKVESEKDNPLAHFQLGVILKQQRKFWEAEQELKEALRLGSKLVVAQLDLAIVLQKQEKWDEAINTYHLMLEKKPDSPEAYFGLGFCHFRKNELDQAVQFFELVIKYNPLYLDAYVNLGAIYERMNNLDKAGEMLGKALHIDSHCALAYYNLGVVWEKVNNLQKALLCYEKALSLNYIKYGLKERIEKIKKAVLQ